MASIRQARASDSLGLSRVCLLTAAGGSSAEQLHALPELPGLIFSLPYNQLESTFAFVLVDEADVNSEHDQEVGQSVVGYIVGTVDSKKYEDVAERDWWPALRTKFPEADDPTRKPADTRYISLIHSPPKTPHDIAVRFPTHIHINILPSHQRKSYGSALMATAITHLREAGRTGLHIGLDPSNEPAKRFYSRRGFERIDTEGGEWWGLEFEKFRR